jgi:hypothetical protein
MYITNERGENTFWRRHFCSFFCGSSHSPVLCFVSLIATLIVHDVAYLISKIFCFVLYNLICFYFLICDVHLYIKLLYSIFCIFVFSGSLLWSPTPKCEINKRKDITTSLIGIDSSDMYSIYLLLPIRFEMTYKILRYHKIQVKLYSRHNNHTYVEDELLLFIAIFTYSIVKYLIKTVFNSYTYIWTLLELLFRL